MGTKKKKLQSHALQSDMAREYTIHPLLNNADKSIEHYDN